MPNGPSTLSLAAAGLYAFIAILCLVASAVAWRGGQARWHWRAWQALAVLFIVLCALRVLDLEATVRDALRLAMRNDGTYSERRVIQRPILAVGVLVAAGVMLSWGNVVRRLGKTAPDWSVLAASSAALALLCLVGLRWISLHAIDAVLYGALKVNWLVDIGSTLLVGALALHYLRLVAAKRR